MSEGECPDAAESERQLKGTRFSLVCVLVFLLPIVLAILAALRYPDDPTRGLFAGIAGFVSGTLLSTFITRITRVEGIHSH